MSSDALQFALDTAQRAVEIAASAGASAAEATVAITHRYHVEARESTIARLERSTARTLHVRAFAEGRKALLSTSDLSASGMHDAIAATVAQAKHVAVDEFAALPESFAKNGIDLRLYDAALVDRDGDA